MALISGQNLGNYQILSLLGVGGMGEVYKARDIRLDRVVAIKVLRPEFTLDTQHRRRFEQEARVVSKLNHPHICTLYDVGRETAIDFLVMEYVEGKTLADRLREGRLHVKPALRLSIEIAGALVSAHRQNIIHRDLKPGNIMFGKSGAKLLDFGLARLKTEHTPRPPSDLSASSAPSTKLMEHDLTGEGARVGTPAYMAPEQINGQRVDSRTDIFAFGLLLYEVFTGRRPFDDTAAILTMDPPAATKVRTNLPDALDPIIANCLEKNPDDRWQSMHDVLKQLEAIEKSGVLPSRARTRVSRFGWKPAFLVGLGLVGSTLLLVLSLRHRTPQEVIRFSVPAPQGSSGHEPFWSHPAISPNGRFLAFVASTAGKYQLCLRPIEVSNARVLAGTEGALAPFWSPDSRSIAFFADGKLKRLDVEGEAIQTICSVLGASASGSWGDGTILYAVREAPGREGLYQVRDSGGEPSKVKIQDSSRADLAGAAFFPEFLPDGRRFLFPTWSSSRVGVYLGSLGSPEAKPVITGSAFRADYVPPGYLMAVVDGTLFVRKFDPGSLRLQGAPIPIAENVLGFGGAGAFSVSTNGALVYSPEGVEVTNLIWFDRSGREVGSIGAAANHNYVSISPDGNRCAVTIQDSRTSVGDIWIYQFPQGTAMRLLSDPSDKLAPVWSPDATHVAFSSSRDGAPHLFEAGLQDTIVRILVPQNGHFQRACDWSRDGRELLFTERDPRTSYDLWRVPVQGNQPPLPVVQTRFVEAHGSLSPDGRWLAYDSDESGRFEIYVQPYPGPGEKRRVSLAGGSQARWRSDGKELFYLASDHEFTAAPFESGSTPAIGPPRTLFQVPGRVRDYDVSKDGRFLVNADMDPRTEFRIQVILNWPAGVHP